MKISQVEELVGITRKNIRFYEEQGLLQPPRNPENGYREYGLSEVELLRKIRLLRKLAVPVEDIRQVVCRETALKACLSKRLEALEQMKRNASHMQLICRDMLDEDAAFDSMDVGHYLEKMNALEKGGIQFMDIEKTDKKKRKIAPIVFAVVTVVFILCIMYTLIQANAADPAPLGIMVIMIAMCVLVIVGVLYACRERIKEIEGGEWDEARKY